MMTSWMSRTIFSGFALAGQLGCAELLLKPREAELLITNVPKALEVRRRGGCPIGEYAEWAPDLAMVQLRNRCPRSGNGFIANYIVDLHTGRIWSDVDRKVSVDSTRLRALRKSLL